jgi:hypothetical protein
MDVLDSKTNQELLESLLAEIAKSSNEIKCAQRDINKAQGRLQFAIMALNLLIERQGD